LVDPSRPVRQVQHADHGTGDALGLKESPSGHCFEQETKAVLVRYVLRRLSIMKENAARMK
jgi:hypothetical protein